MTYSQDVLIAAHRHSSQNRQELQASTNCGCFYCCEIYAAEISAWIEDDWNGGPPLQERDKWTARCAKCDIDSVLGDASGLPVSDRQFLIAMHKHWFE
jgi:hypothetical protein